MLHLTSVKNPRIKAVLDLSYAKERRKRQLFTVEGAREIARALDCKFLPQEIYYCDEILSLEAKDLLKFTSCEKILVSLPVFEKIAIRGEKDGIVAVFPLRETKLSDLKLSSNPLFLAVQGIEKPGNLGALIRSADATGVDAVFVLDQVADTFHPHVIRNSLGAVFKVPVLSMNSDEFRAIMLKMGVSIYPAALTDRSQSYLEKNYKTPTAFVLGEEAQGLTVDWLDSSNCVMIPMEGIADSLNVSVAGAVLLFEATRQRNLMAGK